MMQAAGKGFLPISAPPRLLAFAGSLMERMAERSGAKPLLTASYGRLSGWRAYYSAAKSQSELGMRYRAMETSMCDGLAYFRSTHLHAAAARRIPPSTARPGSFAAPDPALGRSSRGANPGEPEKPEKSEEAGTEKKG
jgi:hypothetical protein